ncbi:putative 1-pyrroline-5-carboxylate dehydrogenase [Collybia nuda]|uniref:1-pyrroline-5-carboxylate dehydrogenase n=1 Tax=Collybia nuda TaxID=64659 RepID=A0A9P5YGQ9_9AGAR|nr:putative 1-pyrroline-5-carboxylate dehydrogenase [Collybia nuda]
MSSSTYTHHFDTPTYNASVTLDTGLFINGEFVQPVDGGTIDVINPTNGQVICPVSIGNAKDIDIAVKAARTAYKTSWGLKVPGAERGRMLSKFADLVEEHSEELAALESLNVGKPFAPTKMFDIGSVIKTLRYYAGWADKIQGKTIETNDAKFCYTRREPVGVVGQIVPWNGPLYLTAWKIGPALAAGNCIILKPSEFSPFTALRIAPLLNLAGFPPGVINIVNGIGSQAGQAISEHPNIEMVSFTGSSLTGRKVLEAAARSNLKQVTLELGGKSPTIIYDDADLEQAVKWASFGVFFNMGQVCCAGSRIFVQEGIYDEFLQKFRDVAKSLKTGDLFDPTTNHGPQVSKIQFDRVMGYIASGKEESAKLETGGVQIGTEGYFIEPTIFSNAKPSMKIAREEIFGPVATVFKFVDEKEVIDLANDTSYGLACAVFTKDLKRALNTAHGIEAGTSWVNMASFLDHALPFGGYKQSGLGRDVGEYALEQYTQLKSVHFNLGIEL